MRCLLLTRIWRIYVAGNFGSQAVLFAYPLVIEPALGLFYQRTLRMYGLSLEYAHGRDSRCYLIFGFVNLL